MNKLVIVGNGFDLAHGLPTSYPHFMNNFWSNLINTFEDELTKRLVYVNPEYIGLIDKGHEDFKVLLENFNHQSKRYKYRYSKNAVKITTPNQWGDVITVFEFKNQFFKKISLKSIANWVDIESEYYQALKRILFQTSIDNNAKKIKFLFLMKSLSKLKTFLNNT
ncbi:MAG: AbiH family protein [Bacteroidota bacterium]